MLKVLLLDGLEDLFYIVFSFKGKIENAQISGLPIFVVYLILAHLAHLHIESPDHQLVDVVEVIIKGHAVQAAF